MCMYVCMCVSSQGVCAQVCESSAFVYIYAYAYMYVCACMCELALCVCSLLRAPANRQAQQLAPGYNSAWQ